MEKIGGITYVCDKRWVIWVNCAQGEKIRLVQIAIDFMINFVTFACLSGQQHLYDIYAKATVHSNIILHLARCVCDLQ